MSCMVAEKSVLLLVLSIVSTSMIGIFSCPEGVDPPKAGSKSSSMKLLGVCPCIHVAHATFPQESTQGDRIMMPADLVTISIRQGVGMTRAAHCRHITRHRKCMHGRTAAQSLHGCAGAVLFWSLRQISTPGPHVCCRGDAPDTGKRAHVPPCILLSVALSEFPFVLL